MVDIVLTGAFLCSKEFAGRCVARGAPGAILNILVTYIDNGVAPPHHAAQYWRQEAKKQGALVQARLINTSSASGLFGNVGQTNYGAAKAGIAAFTVVSAMELKQYGITVNAIAPRAQTRMTEGLRQLTEEEIARRSPRWGAPIVVWPASQESGDVTGRVFEAGNGILKVAEGWHAGPGIEPVEDPSVLGPRVAEMCGRRGRMPTSGVTTLRPDSA